MGPIRPCRPNERSAIVAIINAAAEAYRGVIPADRWHEPYMSQNEFDDEVAGGVVFWGYEKDGVLIGVMGIQPVRDVDLIRHAYVVPASQHRGVGGALLAHLQGLSSRRMLVGTWADAVWAIRFYQRRGMRLVAVHPGAVDDARRLKPAIPLIGDHGIPIHDELEFELAFD